MGWILTAVWRRDDDSAADYSGRDGPDGRLLSWRGWSTLSRLKSLQRAP